MGWKIENLVLLWLLAVVLVPAGLFLLYRYRRRRALQQLGDPELVEQLLPSRSRVKPVIRFVLYILAFTVLLFTMANPMIGTKQAVAKSQGIDVMIALDISNSMRAEDLQPNRLERAKTAISSLLNRMGDNRIGIVVFAGTAFTQLPLTSDYGAAEVFLSDINTGDISRQGTAIGAAIRQAGAAFAKLEGRGKAIIVISDGENHEGDAEAAALKAAENGIIVNTIGLGSPEGAPIPEYEDGAQVGLKKDRDGNTVMTKLNENMLQRIAAAGKGVYVRGNNNDVGLEAVMSELDKLQKAELNEVRYTEYESLYPLFALFALALLFIETLIGDRKYAWLGRMDMFGEKKTAAK